ncbi:MAG: FHA domain-containing protein [Bacteroidales bacterium]|nr:FHA domain-containing protein [Bacteroidales bacterium]MBQ3594043.1 FHA domain-containing protein [Bacteroidales bacterium]
MKLITIGSSQNATIRLDSSFVSSLHAEIILIDNGDIILTDRNSRNGTFVQNQKVESNKDILVRRGDNIRFADVHLDWNKIPQLPPVDHKKIKGIYGIGSNGRNTYHLTGNTVSRFHATLTETKNGKWFIKDHSTNGTTINGKKITPEKEYQIKQKDVIVCGGVPFENPVPRDKKVIAMKMSAIAAAVILLAVCIRFIIPDESEGRRIKDIFTSGPSIEDMCTASTLVYGEYHYEVTLEDDPFVSLISGWPTKYVFGHDMKEGGVLLKNATIISNINPNYIANYYSNISYTGTAFFISEDGKMATNRHVATPWYHIEEDVNNAIKQEMILLRNHALTVNQLKSVEDLMELQDTELGELIYNHLMQYIESDHFFSKLEEFNGYIMRYKSSNIKISGAHDYLGVAMAGRKYNSALEFDRCTVLKASENPKTDIAIIQLNTGILPSTVKYIYDMDRCIMETKSLKPQTKGYLSIGYPAGFMLAYEDFSEIQPTIHDVKISKIPNEYGFQMQGEAIGGNSGSPVCTKKGQLIGIVWGKSTLLATGSYGVHAKYLKEMYDKTY